ncbi:hypothetical protein GGF37_000580 [Kickxella alabastrina]|nr:hypothetical protein GGF37_000580 [Kickxella alabastrina]
MVAIGMFPEPTVTAGMSASTFAALAQPTLHVYDFLESNAQYADKQNRSREQHVRFLESQQLTQRSRGGNLGVNGFAISKRARRCHSITILTESTPLLMEQGDEFFGPPSIRPHRVRRAKRGNLSRGTSLERGMPRDHRRRVFTAPSLVGGLILETLDEVDSETENCNLIAANVMNSTLGRSSVASTACSRKGGRKSVAELAEEWDRRQRQQNDINSFSTVN